MVFERACVHANDAETRAIDAAVNALQVAVLLVARIDADHDELRRAIVRAARSLATLRPKREEHP